MVQTSLYASKSTTEMVPWNGAPIQCLFSTLANAAIDHLTFLPTLSDISLLLVPALSRSIYDLLALFRLYRANRIKYTAFLSNWNLAAAGHRVRLMITGTYVSGPYDIVTPTLDQVDWTGPARHLVITWPPIGPLKETVFDTDVWAVSDGVVGNIQLAPNPVTNLSSIVFQTTYPQFEAVTFGYVLPYFNDTCAWDPSVFMSLFSDDPSTPSAKRTTFDRNRDIIIGCVVGGIALIVLVIVVAFVVFKNRDNSSQRSHLSHHRGVTES